MTIIDNSSGNSAVTTTTLAPSQSPVLPSSHANFLLPTITTLNLSELLDDDLGLSELSAEQLEEVILEMVATHPSLLPLVQHVLDSETTDFDDVGRIAFDSEDISNLRVKLRRHVDMLKKTALEGWRGKSHNEAQDAGAYLSNKECIDLQCESFCALSLTLERARDYLKIRDARSAIIIMSAVLEICSFDFPLSREVMMSHACQVYLHGLRASWEEAMAVSTHFIPPMERRALVRRLMQLDPILEYHVPDDWSVLIEECRDEHFSHYPVQKHLMDVFEQWEKLRTASTVDSVFRLYEGNITYTDAAIIANANIDIMISELRRFNDVSTMVGQMQARIADVLVAFATLRQTANNFVEAVKSLSVSEGEMMASTADVTTSTIPKSNKDDSSRIFDTDPVTTISGVYYWQRVRTLVSDHDVTRLSQLVKSAHDLSLELDLASIHRLTKSAEMRGLGFSHLLDVCRARLRSVSNRTDQLRQPDVSLDVSNEILSILSETINLQRLINDCTEIIEKRASTGGSSSAEDGQGRDNAQKLYSLSVE